MPHKCDDNLLYSFLYGGEILKYIIENRDKDEQFKNESDAACMLIVLKRIANSEMTLTNPNSKHPVLGNVMVQQERELAKCLLSILEGDKATQESTSSEL